MRFPQCPIHFAPTRFCLSSRCYHENLLEVSVRGYVHKNLWCLSVPKYLQLKTAIEMDHNVPSVWASIHESFMTIELFLM